MQINITVIDIVGNKLPLLYNTRKKNEKIQVNKSILSVFKLSKNITKVAVTNNRWGEVIYERVKE